MFNEFGINYGAAGSPNPAFPVFVGYGYDPTAYISTAQLTPSPYVTQELILAKIGGINPLIRLVDDAKNGSISPANPPNNPNALILSSVIQNVVTEINGYLSSIYPIPLAQTGTVAVIKVTGVSTDGLGTITSIEVVEPGNYSTAPATANTPAYLRHLDPAANCNFWGDNWQQCQTGKGAVLTVAYAAQNYSDESSQTLQAQTVSGTPVIANGGTGYNECDLLVLIGGSSFVPAKIREASLVLICHSLYQRRLAADEKNIFYPQAKYWREFFTAIGEGEKQLDGTYKRFFSAVMSWNRHSVLTGANSR